MFEDGSGDLFKQRLDVPERYWKITEADYSERKLWDAYKDAYENAWGKCSTKHAPWFVIPADQKWFLDLAISQIITETMDELDIKLSRPTIDIADISKKYHRAKKSKSATSRTGSK